MVESRPASGLDPTDLEQSRLNNHIDDNESYEDGKQLM